MPTGSSGGNAIITDQHKPQLWKRTLLTGAVATKNETTASNTLEGAGEINTVTFSAFLSSSTLLISCWGTHNPNPTSQARGQRSPDHAVHRGQPPLDKQRPEENDSRVGKRVNNQHNMETMTTMTEQKSLIQHTIPFPGTGSSKRMVTER